MASTAYRRISADPGVDWLDELPGPQAREVLWDCCGSARWAGQVAAARPLRTRGRLLDYADSAIRRLEWTEVRQALVSFPRLGEAAGTDPTRSSWWTRREWQVFAAAGFEDEALAEAAGHGAREYERRFGYVFLVCGQGRTARQILAALSTRLNNDPRMERLVVRAELAAVTRVRLVTLLTHPARATWPAQPAYPGYRASAGGHAPQRLLSAVSTASAASAPSGGSVLPGGAMTGGAVLAAGPAGDAPGLRGAA